MSRHETTDFDRARDEMMSQIHRCGVLRATPEQQVDWLNDTADYLGDQFPGLSAEEVDELREIGRRFCQPAIPHGRGNTALTQQEGSAESGPESEAPMAPEPESGAGAESDRV